METTDLPDLKYSPAVIEIKTRTIYTRALVKCGFESGNFTKIWRGDLQHLFELYDHYFFDDLFTRTMQDDITFRIAPRMTSSGGMTKYHKINRTYEISLASNLIFQTFRDVDREVKVNGIVCHDRLEATMRILEHEIIHLLEFVLFRDSSCSGQRFRRMGRDIFGHRGVTHRLVTQKERARKQYNLRVGSRVSFDHDGKHLKGRIERITKRATVFVRDPKGEYLDKQRRHYTKYYVPLDDLKPL